MAYTWNKRTWSLHTYVLAYNKNTWGPKTQQAFAHVKVFFLFFLPVNTRTHHQNSLYVNKVPEDFLCSARCLIHPLPCPPECCVYIYIYIFYTHTYSHRFAHRMMINRVFLCRCTDPGVRLCCYGAVHSNVFSRAWENTCSLYSYTKTLAWKKHDEIPLRRPKISPGSSRDTARQRALEQLFGRQEQAPPSPTWVASWENLE